MIVGRCADYVLRNSGNCLKVFFSAPLVSRIRRVAQRQNITEGEAKATVQKNEKLRADNYRYYTRRMWGAAGNFDLSLNTDLGEEFIENALFLFNNHWIRFLVKKGLAIMVKIVRIFKSVSYTHLRAHET